MRGQKLALSKEATWEFLDEKCNGETVATINGQPIWKINGNLWSVSISPPPMRAGERLSQYFNGETFLPLLPLYLFLRGLSPESRWQSPPLRACMMVDDPNLHAQTYGHVDYQSLARLAGDLPFHIAFATVPLDAWGTSSRAAKIFRENSRALSLVIHGNDHLHYELAQPFQNGGRDALAFQSLSRIETLERKAGVRVDRVMAPPHGVCAPEIFSVLRAAGYEGLTTNRWSLWKHNPPEELPMDAGLRPADWMGGLPVLNRFRFKSSICDGEIFMAALFGQPIIPYGHQKDFADDMICFRKVIERINSLGAVRWMSLREILETNYEHYLDSGTLYLRLFSRRIKLKLPQSIRSLQIISSLPAEKLQEFEISWQQEKIRAKAGDQVRDLPLEMEVEISEITDAPNKKKTFHPARKSPVVRWRRLASEIRDRLKF
ncbi:MAG TPA: hypothetical protein VIK59_05960 [Verrucomicrobiae bacterium]